MSKQGLKPTRAQRPLISQNGLDTRVWKVQKDTTEFMQVINPETGEEKILYK